MPNNRFAFSVRSLAVFAGFTLIAFWTTPASADRMRFVGPGEADFAALADPSFGRRMEYVPGQSFDRRMRHEADQSFDRRMREIDGFRHLLALSGTASLYRRM
jgi:hypothetical protein